VIRHGRVPLLPLRYTDYFAVVQETVPEAGIVMTAVGPRGFVGWRWKCRRCGQHLKPNTAGAQSHLAKHLRAAMTPRGATPVKAFRAWVGLCDGKPSFTALFALSPHVLATELFRSRAGAKRLYEDVRRVEIREVKAKKRQR